MSDDILHRYDFHPGTPTTVPLHGEIRDDAKAFAAKILELVPAGRHQALALTAVQEAMMWANAGIAIDTKE